MRPAAILIAFREEVTGKWRIPSGQIRLLVVASVHHGFEYLTITPVDRDGLRLGRPPTREEIDLIVPQFFAEDERPEITEHLHADSLHLLRYTDPPVVPPVRTEKQIKAARRKRKQRKRQREQQDDPRDDTEEDHT